SESAVTSSLASFKTASRTRELRAATSASWNISSRTRCQCGLSSRSLPIAAMYSHASPIVRSVPPSFVGIAEVSFLDRYAGLNMTRKIQSIGQPLPPSLWPFLFALHQCIRVLHLEPIGASGERYRFLTMPSSPKLSGVPEYGLAVFLDVLIEPN